MAKPLQSTPTTSGLAKEWMEVMKVVQARHHRVNKVASRMVVPHRVVLHKAVPLKEVPLKEVPLKEVPLKEVPLRYKLLQLPAVLHRHRPLLKDAAANKVPLVPPVPLVPTARMVTTAKMDLKDPQARTPQLVPPTTLRYQLALPAPQAPQAHVDHQDLRDPLEARDLTEPMALLPARVFQDPQDLPALQALLAKTELQDPLGQLARPTPSLDHQALQELQAPTAKTASQARPVLQARLAVLANRESPENQESLEAQARLAARESMAKMEEQDRQAAAHTAHPLVLPQDTKQPTRCSSTFLPPQAF
jgi:hypothetical protein